MDDIENDDEEEEDDQDMRDPTIEPDELDEEIVESDLELDNDGVVHPDHDDAPQKVVGTKVFEMVFLLVHEEEEVKSLICPPRKRKHEVFDLSRGSSRL